MSCHITFVFKNGERREVEAPEGLSVMEIAHKHRIYEIEGACGGSLACATCHVVVHPEWYDKVETHYEVSEDEEDMLDLAFQLTQTSRLSCQIIMKPELDGLVVALPGADPQ